VSDLEPKTRRIIPPEDDAYFLLDKDKEVGSAPIMACPCGGETFRLAYGNYILWGECAKCGKVYHLYSG